MFRSIYGTVVRTGSPLARYSLTHTFRCAEDADAYLRDLSIELQPPLGFRQTMCDHVHRSDVTSTLQQLLRQRGRVADKPNKGRAGAPTAEGREFLLEGTPIHHHNASTHPQPRASPARAPASHLHRAAGPLRRPRRHLRPVQSITVAHALSGRAPLPPWRRTATESESIRFSL